MLNIICNNCVGGRMYQQLNEAYGNPFIWTLIRPDDFLFLIENYNKIDFSKYKIEYDSENNLFSIIINDSIRVCFPHHIQDDNFNEPTKVANDNQLDIRYYKMKDYICDLYEKRVKRMTNKPIFVIDDKENKLEEYVFKPNKENLKRILDLSKQNRIIVSLYERNNILPLNNSILKPNKPCSTAGIANLILKNEKTKKLLL